MKLRDLLVFALAGLAACGGATPMAPPPVANVPPASGPALAPPVAVAPADTDAEPLPLWPAVKSGTLANGLTYFILKHDKPEKRARLWLVVNAGSILEDDDQRGLAHFNEHMAFNGTKRFPKDALVKYIESIGMRFGADLNAYTDFDETVYQLEVPTDDKSFMDKGLDILRDWAGDVTHDPKEVEDERGVIIEEWRLGRGAFSRIFDKQAKVLFKGSRYADRIPIGLPEIIKGAPRDAITRFYKDWYRPDLMAVFVVGDVDPAAIESEIQKRFGDLVNPAHERPRIHGEVPKADGTRVSINSDAELPFTFVQIANTVPHRNETSKKDFRRETVERVYSAIMSERLATLARAPDAPYSNASAGPSSATREIDSFQLFAQVRGGKIEDAVRVLCTEVVRVERHGFTASELKRAIANQVHGYEGIVLTEATQDSRQFIEELVRHFLAHELVIGAAAERDLALAMLPTITLEELNQVARSFGGPENRAILISSPTGQAVPTQDRVLAIIDEVQKSDIGPWEEKAAVPLMSKLPTPGKIVSEKKIDSVGVTEWTLSNGAVVVVKPTDYEKDSIVLTGSRPGGLASVGAKDFNSARFATEVVEVGGVGDLDADALRKALAGKRVHANMALEESTDDVAAGGDARDLETMLQLLHLRMAAPRRDEQAAAVNKADNAQQLGDLQRAPGFQFALATAEVLYQKNPRRMIPTPADVKEVNLDRALAIYKEHFGDVSGFTFVIVGDVKLDALRPLVETYLASLPGKPGKKLAEKDAHIRKVGGVVKKSWKFGEEPKASVRLDFHGDEQWTRDKDRDLFILGRVLSIRLREILREDMGGVYTLSASGQLERRPHEERSFGISFGCAPENVDKLIKATEDEIAEIAQKGIGDDYLEKVKQTFLRERETELRQNNFWANWLSNAYRFGDDPAIILETAPMVARMTSANVQAAARKFLDGKQVFQAVLLPAK